MILRDICLRFEEKVIFDRFSLELPTCGIICVTGASGRGKTTLLRLIAGLVSPDSGEIINAPKKPSFMFQEDRLLPWFSVAANIKAVCSEQAALSWLSAVELSGDAAHMPSEMSGGMRRRVALARALAYDGDFLLLDEPFTGLDRDLTKRMAALVVARGLPCLAVTHSESEADLLGGRVIAL